MRTKLLATAIMLVGNISTSQFYNEKSSDHKNFKEHPVAKANRHAHSDSHHKSHKNHSKG